MPKISFLNENISVEVDPGRTVRDVASTCGIEFERGFLRATNVGRLLTRLCNGRGICGGCRAWVLGATTAPSAMENLRPSLRGTMRLTCQARVVGELAVRSRPGGPGPSQSSALERAGVPKPDLPPSPTAMGE